MCIVLLAIYDSMYLANRIRSPGIVGHRALPAILKQGYASVTKSDPAHVPLNSILIANRGEIALSVVKFSSHFFIAKGR